jgi:tetratricopeptide (TPR) repeat protein
MTPIKTSNSAAPSLPGGAACATTTIPPFRLTELPPELFMHVISYLPPKDVENLARVSKTTRTITIDAANLNEALAMKSLVTLLPEKLQHTDPNPIVSLQEIHDRIGNQKCSNLRQLKTYILRVKSELIDVLKTLDQDSLEELKASIIPPDFMENIFETSIKVKKLERKFNKAQYMDDFAFKNLTLNKISEALARADQFDRALTVAEKILDRQMQERALGAISEALARADQFDRALTVAERILDKRSKALAFGSVFGALTKAGQFDRAITVAERILDKGGQDCVFEDVSKALAKAGQFDRAITVAKEDS